MIPTAASLLTLGVALTTDLRARRIPNALSLGSAGLAVAFHLLFGEGLGFALAGFGVGLICLLGAFLLGGMGGGDVKLLACLGAWLGPKAVLVCFAYTALVGAGISLAVIAARRLPIDWRAPLNDATALLVTGRRPSVDARHRFPYSVAIAAGCSAFLVFGAPL